MERRRQARGERRMAEILDAAADAFAELGYEKASTNAIAARAGISPGSLYQFFPSKEAVARALADRFVADMRAAHAAAFADADLAGMDLGELLDRVVDPLVAFNLANPGFKALFARPDMPSALAESSQPIQAAMLGQVESILDARVPGQAPADRARSARVLGPRLPGHDAARGGGAGGGAPGRDRRAQEGAGGLSDVVQRVGALVRRRHTRTSRTASRAARRPPGHPHRRPLGLHGHRGRGGHGAESVAQTNGRRRSPARAAQETTARRFRPGAGLFTSMVTLNVTVSPALSGWVQPTRPPAALPEGDEETSVRPGPTVWLMSRDFASPAPVLVTVVVYVSRCPCPIASRPPSTAMVSWAFGFACAAGCRDQQHGDYSRGISPKRHGPPRGRRKDIPPAILRH